MTKRRSFLVLDRDGTVIVERNYLGDPEGVELLPGVADALARLSTRGLPIYVVTNQSGVARGFFDAATVDRIHARLSNLLEARSVRISGYYVCPHHPDEGCACRKPAPGLAHQLAAEHGLEPNDGYYIGDKACDVELGRRVGGRTFLVRTGHGADQPASAAQTADFAVDTLADAVRIIERLEDGR